MRPSGCTTPWLSCSSHHTVAPNSTESGVLSSLVKRPPYQPAALSALFPTPPTAHPKGPKPCSVRGHKRHQLFHTPALRTYKCRAIAPEPPCPVPPPPGGVWTLSDVRVSPPKRTYAACSTPSLLALRASVRQKRRARQDGLTGGSTDGSDKISLVSVVPYWLKWSSHCERQPSLLTRYNLHGHQHPQHCYHCLDSAPAVRLTKLQRCRISIHP